MPKLTYSNTQVANLLSGLETAYGPTVTREQVLAFIKKKALPMPYFLFKDPARRAGRGSYRVAGLPAARTIASSVRAEVASARQVTPPPAATLVHQAAGPKVMTLAAEDLIPERDSTFVPFGFYQDLHDIIASKKFCPVYITGLSGNGKTFQAEQACAALKREAIRIPITEETDEEDLIGGPTLVDGSIVQKDGLILVAMRRGAVCILDEVDLNATKILCLQGIMEGKPYIVKKTGEKVYPQPGFNIIATANTKGRNAGGDRGEFVGTKYLNEAFLERFPLTFEQTDPVERVEKKILEKNLKRHGLDKEDDHKFVAYLIAWAAMTRKAFNEGVSESRISTRRLVHIINTYAIFPDRLKAITLCLNRFDGPTKEGFLDLYAATDPTVERRDNKEEVVEETKTEDNA